MIPQQLFALWAEAQYLHPDRRAGQNLVNALREYDDVAYARFCSDAALPTDCFYRDDKLATLIDVLTEHYASDADVTRRG